MTKSKPGRGRPPGPATDVKRRRIMVRLTESEYETVEQFRLSHEYPPRLAELAAAVLIAKATEEMATE